MERIGIGNTDSLQKDNLKVSRKSKKGLAITLSLALIFGSLYGLHLDDVQDKTEVTGVTTYEDIDLEMPSIKDEINIEKDVEVIEPTQKDPINASLDDINSMNIIINDADCMGEFMNSVCQELENDGIKFTYTNNCQNIDVDGAVIFTLDQQYMAGPNTAVFAPLENGRLGNSDALALAVEKSLYEKGFLVDKIACGQIGFRENEDGTISERVPTATEEAIGDYTDASYVTVSFGTSNNHVGAVAHAIEGALTRYYSYISSNYGNNDLIYCVEPGQDYNDVANILGTTSDMIDIYNNMVSSDILLTGETIINPNVGEIREFNQSVSTNLYVDKTLRAK